MSGYCFDMCDWCMIACTANILYESQLLIWSGQSGRPEACRGQITNEEHTYMKYSLLITDAVMIECIHKPLSLNGVSPCVSRS